MTKRRWQFFQSHESSQVKKLFVSFPPLNVKPVGWKPVPQHSVYQSGNPVFSGSMLPRTSECWSPGIFRDPPAWVSSWQVLQAQGLRSTVPVGVPRPRTLGHRGVRRCLHRRSRRAGSASDDWGCHTGRALARPAPRFRRPSARRSAVRPPQGRSPSSA